MTKQADASLSWPNNDEAIRRKSMLAKQRQSKLTQVSWPNNNKASYCESKLAKQRQSKLTHVLAGKTTTKQADVGPSWPNNDKAILFMPKRTEAGALVNAMES